MDTNVDDRNRRYPLRRAPALLKVQQRVADGYLLSTRRPAGFPLATCFPVRLREPRTESDPQETSKRFGGKKVSGEPGGQRPSAGLAAYDVAETVRTLFPSATLLKAGLIWGQLVDNKGITATQL
jgi:hypothetical protein